jgi:nicotinamide phosphoribosyltransferase
VRPDSGYPPQISVDVLKSLWNSFGGTVNAEGYKVLDPHVGVIYGDGIDIESIDRILFNVVDLNGFAPSNIVFGCGGALLQQVNRDTQQFAFKCSAAQINGKWVDIWKDPVTDTGKASKRGRQFLLKEEGVYRTSNNPWESPQDVMQVVFENGVIRKTYTFDEVRKNAAACLTEDTPSVVEVADF